MGVIKELVQRADSWVNAMTGLGTLRDKLMHAQVVPGAKLEDHVLEALFNDDDVARRIVSKLPREATRRGFKLVLEGDSDTTAPADVMRAMELQFRTLEAMPKLRDGWIWARLYGGGSGVLVGADDGRSVDQPLNEAGIRSIQFLNLVKRPQLTIKRRYEDVTAPEYGKPEIYTISQSTMMLAPRTGLDVHASRLILFDGALTARMTMDSPTGFDDSVLQQAMTTLQQTATAWQSTAHLMTDASQGVLKIANLVDLVAADGQETLRSRIQLMDLARSVCRSILIDAEKESFERVSTSFAGLPEVMDRLMMRMSATAEQPVTLLYGRSPAGLNATGESDIRGWYDTVAEAQTDELKPRLERLIKLMFLAKDSPTRGQVPEDWCIEFNPLWQPTDKEAADTKKVKADTYVALVTAQIMTDAEAGIGLAPDFPTIDVEARTELAEADKEEGLRPREVNAPAPPELEPGDEGEDDDAGDEEGGGDSTDPKGRSDSQPRVPSGSPQGGQFASNRSGGRSALSGSERAAYIAPAKAKLAAAKASGDKATEEHARKELRAARALAGASNPSERAQGRTLTVEEKKQRKVEQKEIEKHANEERKAYEQESRAKEAELVDHVRTGAKEAEASERANNRAFVQQLHKEHADTIRELDRHDEELDFKAELKAAMTDGVPSGEFVTLPATTFQGQHYPEQRMEVPRTAPNLNDALSEERLTPSDLRDSDAWARGRIDRDDMLEHAVPSNDWVEGWEDATPASMRQQWTSYLSERRIERDEAHTKLRHDFDRVRADYVAKSDAFRGAVRQYMNSWVREASRGQRGRE